MARLLISLVVVSIACGRVGFEDLSLNSSPDADERDLREVGVEVQASPSNVNASDPSLSWNGRNFGLTWHQNPRSSRETYFRLLDASLRPAAPPVELSVGLPPHTSSCVAASEDFFAVVWRSERATGFDIQLSILSASGEIVVPETLLASTPAAGDVEPEVVWTGTHFAVTWVEEDSGFNRVRVSFIATDGVIQSAGYASPAIDDADHAVLGTHRGQLAVAWRDRRDGLDRAYLSVYDENGVQQRETAVTDFSVDVSDLSLAGSDFGWLLAAERGPSEERQLSVNAVSLDATTVQPDNFVQPGFLPDTASANEGHVLAFQNDPLSQGDLFLQPLDAAGTALAPPSLVVASGAGDAALSRSGELIAIAWEDERSGFDEITATLLAPF